MANRHPLAERAVEASDPTALGTRPQPAHVGSRPAWLGVEVSPMTRDGLNGGGWGADRRLTSAQGSRRPAFLCQADGRHPEWTQASDRDRSRLDPEVDSDALDAGRSSRSSTGGIDLAPRGDTAGQRGHTIADGDVHGVRVDVCQAMQSSRDVAVDVARFSTLFQDNVVGDTDDALGVASV